MDRTNTNNEGHYRPNRRVVGDWQLAIGSLWPGLMSVGEIAGNDHSIGSTIKFSLALIGQSEGHS